MNCSKAVGGKLFFPHIVPKHLFANAPCIETNSAHAASFVSYDIASLMLCGNPSQYYSDTCMLYSWRSQGVAVIATYRVAREREGVNGGG